MIPKWERKSALFLDRDGVINIDYGFVHSMDKFKYIEGAKEIIKKSSNIRIILKILAK